MLWKQNVSSDPLSTDTDGDLLDDHEERRLGTSPTVADSDNDGSDDYYEVSNDYDPTIHDHKAPLVEPLEVSATDIHDNRKRTELSGPDTFGQAADKYASFPASLGKGGFVAWMGLSSGASTVVGESVAGVAQMVSDPGGYASQMAQLATTIANNPAIITKLPQMMASQLRQQHETRNPFDSREQYYQEFGGGWSLGYSTGTVAPAFASGGSSVLQKELSSSSKLRRLVDAAGALLQMDDAATQRRFVKTHKQGEVSTNELSTAVKHYDNLDPSGKGAADDVLAATGDDDAEKQRAALGE
ncbi:hypothetical protein ACOZ4F_01950 [Haloarcula marismortui]|uniref:hypothetical protein n=1 Tax=Haloarcula marismortui TaxID=2238 RepID=UPI003C70720A